MRRLLAISMVLIVAGCGGAGIASPGPSSNASPVVTATAGSTPVATDTLGPFDCSFPYSREGSTDRAQISGLRVAPQGGYDRIVFEFLGVGPTAAVPTLEIKVGTPPFTRDPSGLPMTVAGSAFLVVTLHGGTGVDPSGMQTYAGPTDIKAGLPFLQELAMAGDFEAVSTWIIGLPEPTCVRVLALAAPNRLVIDLGR